jgi:uncharacterized Zn-finger protein
MESSNTKHEPEAEFILLLQNYGPLVKRKVKNENENRFKCNLCGKKLETSRALARHSRHKHKIHEQKRFCSKCTFEADTLEELRIHGAKVHLGQFCKFCNRIFEKKSDFNKHMNIHENSENFKCKNCGIEFESFRGIANHFYSYHNQKTFQCEVCQKSFGLLKSLKQHIASYHESKLRKYIWKILFALILIFFF